MWCNLPCQCAVVLRSRSGFRQQLRQPQGLQLSIMQSIAEPSFQRLLSDGGLMRDNEYQDRDRDRDHHHQLLVLCHRGKAGRTRCTKKGCDREGACYFQQWRHIQLWYLKRRMRSQLQTTSQPMTMSNADTGTYFRSRCLSFQPKDNTWVMSWESPLHRRDSRLKMASIVTKLTPRSLSRTFTPYNVT